jgi:two-component system, OmpR family, response regulator MprA
MPATHGADNTANDIAASVTILVADDDAKMSDMVRRTLAYEGYRVIVAGNGHDALIQARDHRPALIVLDWTMPMMDGLSVAQRVHAVENTPILMLTGRAALEDKIDALHAGVDDYLVKPFAPEELVARVRALLRRVERANDERPMGFLDLALNPGTREVRRAARTINLTPREFDLLKYFLKYPNRVLKRDQLLQDVWGYQFGGDDTVLEVYVGYLRNKLEEQGESRIIQTVRGVGYALRESTG